MQTEFIDKIKQIFEKENSTDNILLNSYLYIARNLLDSKLPELEILNLLYQRYNKVVEYSDRQAEEDLDFLKSYRDRNF